MSASPVPSVRWNSLERQTGKLSTHHHHERECASSSTTSLLQIGGAGTSSRAVRSSGSSSSSTQELGGQQQLQLLSVPQPHSPLEEAPGGGEGSSSSGSRFRRYSCNPPTKGGLTSSPQPHLRRSSLAAIKWSVLARRISMGMAHEREPPQDPTQVGL